MYRMEPDMDTEGKLVHIQWYDTTVYTVGSGIPYQPLFPTIAQAVGWITYEDETFIEIRPGVARQHSGIPDRTIFALFIPKGSIKHRAELTDMVNVGVDWCQVQQSIDKSMPYSDGAGTYKNAYPPKVEEDAGDPATAPRTIDQFRELLKEKHSTSQEGPKVSPEHLSKLLQEKQKTLAAEAQVQSVKPWPHPLAPVVKESADGPSTIAYEDIDTATTGDFKDGPEPKVPFHGNVPDKSDLTGSK